MCELPTPTVLRREGTAVLEMWELPASPVWFSEELPASAAYAEYRSAIGAAGANLVRPVSDPPQPKDEAEREMWRREAFNERRCTQAVDRCAAFTASRRRCSPGSTSGIHSSRIRRSSWRISCGAAIV